jgi:YVTN family beta-propeller protein
LRARPVAWITGLLFAACVASAQAEAGPAFTSLVVLEGTASVKTKGPRRSVGASLELRFGADAFELSLGPCYTATGLVKPKGRQGDKLQLVPGDESRPALRAFLALLAANAGAGPAAPLRDRTKLLLTLHDNATATLALKSTLTAKRARSTRIKAELAGTIESTGLDPGPPACRFAGPTSSQPLALSARGDLLAVANPDNDTVSFFDVRPGSDLRVAEVAVGDEPNGVAFLPDGSKAYAANTVSGTLSVIPVDVATGVFGPPAATIPVGAEPYGLALSPTGAKLYVANARSDSVSVIDTATDAVVATIPNVGREPRGLAITNDGDADDADEKLYVTQFLARLDPGKIEGADDAKSGRVAVVDTATDAVIGTLVVPPLADSGFPASGDALGRVAPAEGLALTTGAYPNQLNNLAVKGGLVYVPSTGASPNGPLRFDVNVQSLLSVLDPDAGVATATISLQVAVAAQASSARRFLTVPWALAFERTGDAGWVVSAASDVVAKVGVDPGTGAPSVQLDPSDPRRVLEIAVGKNPRGIVVDAADTRAYVMNYVSRDVTILDLATSPERAVRTLPSASLPEPGTAEELVHVGRELYNTSVGVFDPPPGERKPLAGRMSQGGWGSCSACHPFGLSDGVVWLFPDGPRRTIAQHADFDPSDPLRLRQRALNASAVRDEEEDFELNIRAVSGGAGLIVLADGATPDPDVASFLPLASGARNQLRVRGVPAWDALDAYVRFGIRAPISPRPETDPDAIAGRALFAAANCQACHGTSQWTQSFVRFTPPPDAGLVATGQILGELRAIGTFDPGAFNEVTATAGPPRGADGFAIPSLLSGFAFEGTLLHGGAAATFDEVLLGVVHRSAGTSGVDTLTNAADRAKIAVFLRTIDASTPAFP